MVWRLNKQGGYPQAGFHHWRPQGLPQLRAITHGRARDSHTRTRHAPTPGASAAVDRPSPARLREQSVAFVSLSLAATVVTRAETVPGDADSALGSAGPQPSRTGVDRTSG